MNYVPTGLSRLGHRQLLKIRKNSPTLLVVGGVVGFGVTAVLAAKATRKIDPILEDHAKKRQDVRNEMVTFTNSQHQRMVVQVYAETSIRLVRLYAPTLVVGTISTASVLHGHRILQARHLATMAAYSGLMDQYKAYRERVAETIGEELELELHNGAVGEYKEDPDHPGEYKMVTKKSKSLPENYLRPFFDESNDNWTRDPSTNYMFLKGIQAFFNKKLQIKGYVFLSDVYEGLGMREIPHEAIVTGWLYDSSDGDGYIDFGFMTEKTPEAAAFRNQAETSVRLNFNVDGPIWNKF